MKSRLIDLEASTTTTQLLREEKQRKNVKYILARKLFWKQKNIISSFSFCFSLFPCPEPQLRAALTAIALPTIFVPLKIIKLQINLKARLKSDKVRNAEYILPFFAKNGWSGWVQLLFFQQISHKVSMIGHSLHHVYTCYSLHDWTSSLL